MEIMEKRTVVTTNSMIIKAKRKTCIKNGRISQYWITVLKKLFVILSTVNYTISKIYRAAQHYISNNAIGLMLNIFLVPSSIKLPEYITMCKDSKFKQRKEKTVLINIPDLGN